jgi:hypothetical protein
MQIKIPSLTLPGGGGAGGSNPRPAGPDLSPHSVTLMSRLSMLKMRVRSLEGRVAHQDTIIAALQRQSGSTAPYPRHYQLWEARRRRRSSRCRRVLWISVRCRRTRNNSD